MSLRPIKIRKPRGTKSQREIEAQKAFVHKVVAGRPPCALCKKKQRKLIGELCVTCSTRMGQWGHHDSSPPPKLYDLDPETTLIQEIVRVNRDSLQPAIQFFDYLLESVIAGCSPMSPKVNLFLLNLHEVGAKGEDLFCAFTAPFANLYLGRKWTGKRAPLVRWVKDDENAKAFAGHLVLSFTKAPKYAYFSMTGGMRKELAKYVLANIGVLVYRVAKACVQLVEKRKQNEAKLAEIQIEIPN
jgi:hypothetical protein